MSSAPNAIDITNVRKDYGTGQSAVTALRSVSFDIRDNEFFTLLGPSGCGKTTLLRLIAGFEAVTAGEIFLFGEEIENLPPNKRPVNTVFQNYALFPHMTVAENVAFGLERLGRTKSDASTRAREMLDLVQLGDYAARRPSQLSGGQQQRVALARALAPAPKVLLLDEPLSALDLKLRQAMRVELKEIQRNTGITFVFVTHDQEEALTMSDRIAVMSSGEVQQIGDPADIYEAPANRFVADFIGETNILPVTVDRGTGGSLTCRLASGIVLNAVGDANGTGPRHLSIRPERIGLRPAGETNLSGTVDRLIYLGTDTQHMIHLADGTEIVTRSQNAGDATTFEPGDAVSLKIDPSAARVLSD